MAYTTIDNPELYFQAKTYTGNGSTQSITLDGDENMQPDLVWIKQRNAGSTYHWLADVIRGVTKYLSSNVNSVEATETTQITSFDSDGFSLGNKTNTNDNSDTYVAWCWKESATAGFDIVTYTGNETARTISHSLSAKPKIIICKGRSVVSNWTTQHGSYGAEKQFQLQETDAVADNATTWNDTEPTTSVFSVGTSTACNDNEETFVAYLFAEKQGYSKFGTYTTNGNANGSFTYLGFKPAFVIHKQAGSTGDWRSWNNKSNPHNPMNHSLFPNTDADEYDTDAVQVDFVSNGIKWRQTDTTNNNPSGGTFIYMAWAEAPFVNSNGVPCNAR